MEFWIIMAIIFGAIGYFIDDNQGRGVAIGALLGPIGLVISAIQKGK